MGTKLSRPALIWMLPLVLAAGRPASAGQDLRLVTAAAEQDTPTVRVLLDEGVEVNTTRADGVTALLWAAHRDDLPMLDLLLEGATQSFQFQSWPETASLLENLGADTRLGIPGTVQERLRDIPTALAP